jgi:uncharacterized protein YjbI with pentapeptide repeats
MPVQPADQIRALAANRQTARDLSFRGASLRGLDMAALRGDGLSFEEADLREATLKGMRLTNCILRDARLESADFSNAVMRMCDLDGVRADSANFSHARLENSTARGARFDNVSFEAAVLTDTDFSRSSLRDANLAGVQASGAAFRGADLSRANLRNASLVDADFRGADLTDADLEGADLRGADMRGAIGAGMTAPSEIEALSETMAPIVGEILRTAGKSGYIDAETLSGLMHEVNELTPAASQNVPGPDAMAAVSRVLSELGDDVLPKLMRAFAQPPGSEPPPEVQALILRLRDHLGLDETATAEDVFERLSQGFGR